jgi:hypothetical protein
MDVLVSQTGWPGFWLIQSVEICSTKPSSAKPDDLVSKTRGSKIFRSSDNLGETMPTEPDNWRTPLVRYLENPCHIDDRTVRRQALKYVILDNNLYQRTIDGLLLKCLGSDQSRIAMGEVHEGICGTH